MSRHPETNPPVLLQAVLRALLDARDKETIPGDLLEEYRNRAEQGARSALGIWYVRQVMSFVSPASLRRVLLPGSLAWTVAAGITELTLLIVAPEIAGVPPEWAILGCSAIVFASMGGCVMRMRATRHVVFLASSMWIIPFLAAALFTLRLPIFNPLPGVAAFFVCAAAAALSASERTGKISAGIAAATVTGLFIAVFTAAATTLLRHPHPPLASFLVIPGIAAIVGVVAGSFGRRFGRFSPVTPELLSVTASALIAPGRNLSR